MMYEDKKLNMLEAITGESDQNVLSTYLYLAEQKVLSVAYPYHEDVPELPSKYDGVVIEIASFMLNKRGAEGEIRHTENGIDRTFDDSDIPVSLLRKITPCASVL